jgi:hypothetical protein
MIDRSTGRRLLGPSRVRIMSNGSGDPEPLSALIDRLDGIPLDPWWEREYGNFAFTSSLYFQRRGSNKHTHRKVWEDFGPEYSDAPNAVLFFGNFYQISGLFHIVTDDSEIIEVLLDAIEANLGSRAYQRARSNFKGLGPIPPRDQRNVVLGWKPGITVVLPV